MKKYSRKITELSPQGESKKFLPKGVEGLKGIVFIQFFKFSLLALLLISFVTFSLAVLFLYRENEKLIISRVEAQNKYMYWVKMTEKHSNYAKTFYMAAVYSMTLGNKNEAIKYLNRAINVDPDFIEAREFKNEIVTGSFKNTPIKSGMN